MARIKISEVEKEFLDLFENGVKYDSISSILNISKSAISSYVKDHNLTSLSKRKCINEDAFNTFSEESVYWLGFLWADGYVQNTNRNKTIDLECIDEEHIVKFQKFLNVSKYTTRTRNNSTTYRLTCSSNKLVTRLYELGFSTKDNRTNIPDIPNKYIVIFLRGYFDGDGHIRISNEQFEGIDISGRRIFIDNIYNKFPYFLRKELHSTCSERIYTNKELGKKFLYDIYHNANIYLDRKYKCALLFRE